MAHIELIDILPCQNILGEGVQWNHRDQSVWWTDIESCLLYRYSLVDKKISTVSTPERVGCFAFVDGDSRLLLALATGIAWFDLTSGKHEWIARPEIHLAGNRFNDGRVDRQGRFWAGTVVEEPANEKHSNEKHVNEEQNAALYCLSGQQQLTRHLSGLKISNSLCWSPDSSKIYHADSPSHQIRVYDFNQSTAEMSNPRVFAQLPEGVEPDGACIDADGYLWNAQWGGSQVVRYAPDGSVDNVVELPVTQPTCVAFGGPDLDLLLVTSARKGLDPDALAQQPAAGSLLIFQTNVQGLRESWYRTD